MSGGKNERGFALIVVVLIVALLAVAAATLLDLVNVDLDLVGQQRRLIGARQISDGAMLEQLNSEQFGTHFPDFTNVENPLPTPSDANSLFVNYVGTSVEETYQGKIRLLRFAPVAETSLNMLHAVTYEVSTVSDINNGQASNEARTEIIKIVPYPKGVMLPRHHAR
jgi:hypothetical protein